MAAIKRVGGLEIAEDLDFQKREWAMERAGWVVMALLIVAALAGLLGHPGPLSNTTLTNPEGTLTLEYERFAQLQAPMILRLHLQNVTPDTNGEVAVWVSADYAEQLQVQTAMPAPTSVTAGPERLTFRFKLAEQSATLSLHAQPENVGLMQAQVGLADQPPLSFWQFVYP